MTVFEIYMKDLDKHFPGKQVLTVPQVARYIGLNPATVKKEITPTAGREYGKRKLYSKASIAKYLAGQRRDG